MRTVEHCAALCCQQPSDSSRMSQLLNAVSLLIGKGSFP